VQSIVVAATHDTSYQNDAGGIKASSRWLSEATPPVMRSRCISHLLGNFLGLKYNSLIIAALSTNGAVHTSLGQRPRTCGRTKKNPSCLRSRTKGPRAETGGMVKRCFVVAYAVLGRCPRLVWDGPSALKPNPLIYRCIRVL